jgi:hypothetical protein
MKNFGSLCSDFGIPIANEKTEGPCQVMIFLGLEIDTLNMVVRIPQKKLGDLRVMIVSALNKKKITLKNLQSITGLMNFCLRAIPPGRVFAGGFMTQ